jgi:hypothetical protein|tara:strand:- start:42 stop:518 length:477 start_codon:yes stop_codon:yes gene_type:complete
MKIHKFKLLLIFCIILSSCAKPTVTDVVIQGDEDLNCLQLKDEYLETRRFKQEAIAVQNSQGGNTTRALLFWPALLKTLHNADVAIEAADKRAFHIIDIMKKKNCNESEKLFRELTNQTEAITSNKKISDEIKELNALYKEGILTKKEYEQAKKKVLE